MPPFGSFRSARRSALVFVSCVFALAWVAARAPASEVPEPGASSALQRLDAAVAVSDKMSRALRWWVK